MARSKRLGLKLLASRIPHEGDLANLMPGDYASFRARFPMIYEGRCFFINIFLCNGKTATDDTQHGTERAVFIARENTVYDSSAFT